MEDGEEREGLIAAEEGRGGAERGKGLPPKWVDITDEINDVMDRLRQKMATLEKLHAKHVLPGFNDRSKEEREIEGMTADITRDLRRSHTLLTQIRPASNERNEIITAQNVQRGLAAKVQDLSGTFRKKQRVYMQKLQGHAIKNKDLLAASGAITLKGPESLDELEEDIQASAKQISQSQSDAYATSPSISDTIRQRDHELTEIAKSISELADLFRDIGNLVVEQGTVLDCVEYNVTETAREVKGAVEELKVATKYQKNAGRRRCIFLLILIILGLVIVLIYKPHGSHLPPPPRPQNEEGVIFDTTSSYSSHHRSRTIIRPPSLPTGRPKKVRPTRTKTTQQSENTEMRWRPRGRRRMAR